ncbi:tensin-3-like [Macrosteles quadrilineatus]|uniref:tensin-3-like n=1 Tax=Macrosteles quadrilineatus TaxID=74068 RepID=UPI0023E29685|nr:tensin-3-like [Macrosteles quadrilineatus]
MNGSSSYVGTLKACVGGGAPLKTSSGSGAPLKISGNSGAPLKTSSGSGAPLKPNSATLSGAQCTRTLRLNGLTVTATLPPKSSPASDPTDDTYDLPDGSCFRRTLHKPGTALRKNLNPRTAAIRPAKYMGSIPVAGPDQSKRADFVRSKLERLRGCSKSKPVLLVISLTGIKVCSPDGKSVYMAHALRRISYATCDPTHCQFSFLAREPKGHCSLQYCHAFVTKTAEQSVYMAHALRRISYATCDPTHCQFSFLAREPKGHCSLQYCHAFVTKTAEQAEELNSIVGNAFRMAYAAQLQRAPTFHDVIASQLQDSQRITWPKQIPGTVSDNMDTMNVNSGSPPTLVLHKTPPSSIPGLRTYHTHTHTHTHTHSDSTHSTPSSEESNSPTELNSYKRLADKPPLIKRLAMGLTGTTPPEEDGFPLVDPVHPDPQPPTGKLLEFENNRLSQSSPSSSDTDLKTKRISQISSSSSSVSGTGTALTDSSTPPPPLPPERTDSLKPEEGELRAAPWFQAGIPREITLEVLGQEPVGAFMVRESTSKPGCFALSLRVPREFQPLGIAHYLILRTSKGYKIKGFTKEFSTLTALITHHSVMPELLPCPLSLNRYNPSFVKSDSNKDFADIDSDPDYNTLADFRKMMADLNV